MRRSERSIAQFENGRKEAGIALLGIDRSIKGSGRRRIGVIINSGSSRSDEHGNYIAPRAGHRFGALQSISTTRYSGEADTEPAAYRSQREQVAGYVISRSDLNEDKA